MDGRYRLEKLNEQNADTALSICNANLGEGLYTRMQLLRLAGEEAGYYYLVYDGGEAAGLFFCSGMRGSEAAAAVTKEIAGFCGAEEWIGVCRSIAVKPAYRKSGLAEALLRHFSALLRQKEKVNKIFALAWKKHGYIPASNILETCGFANVAEIHRPWYEKTGLQCPACEKTRCECDGQLYCKVWSEEK